MECKAILDLVKEAYFEQNFVVGTVVADDDTTMKKILQHNYKKQVEDGKLDKKDWPLNKKGKLLASLLGVLCTNWQQCRKVRAWWIRIWQRG